MTCNGIYDVVIVGSGIGGLVAGCYLGRAGLRVLILEKNNSIGGFNSSLFYNGFKFNTFIHSYGSFGGDRILKKVFFDDLNLQNRIQVRQKDLIAKILTNNLQFNIYRDYKRTVNELIDIFPRESKNIESFFSYISSETSIRLFLDLKSITQEEFLSRFFYDEQLKNLLKIPASLFATDIEKLPAFAFAICYRDTLFDGGYYFVEGGNSLNEALKEKFLEFGGEIRLNHKVTKIFLKDQKELFVEDERGNVFAGQNLVSDIDLNHLCNDLIGGEFFDKKFLNGLSNLMKTYSMFLLHLGLKRKIVSNIVDAGTIFYSERSDISSYLHNLDRGDGFLSSRNFLINLTSKYNGGVAPDGCESISIFQVVPSRSPYFWEKNRGVLRERLIKDFLFFCPGVGDQEIQHVQTWDPYRIERYDGSIGGAARGWATSLKNVFPVPIRQGKILENVYCVGHWAFSEAGQGGVPMVVSTAVKAARSILIKTKEK